MRKKSAGTATVSGYARMCIRAVSAPYDEVAETRTSSEHRADDIRSVRYEKVVKPARVAIYTRFSTDDQSTKTQEHDHASGRHSYLR